MIADSGKRVRLLCPMQSLAARNGDEWREETDFSDVSIDYRDLGGTQRQLLCLQQTYPTSTEATLTV
jgi:hypothetical protein